MSTKPKIISHQLLEKRAVADLYFLEHRARLIDIAAFFDRYDRAESDSDEIDFRIVALSKACLLLTDGTADRARRVLELFSDMSDEIPLSTQGAKGACGAVNPTGVQSLLTEVEILENGRREGK